MKKLYGIVGPTASGKTGAAIELCRRLRGEIVSADSMQIYKGMRILSAQPTEEELKQAPHHLVSFVSPETKFDAIKYREAADTAIAEIESRGVLPILCGGTGLYVDALTKDMKMSEEADPVLRKKLLDIAAEPDGEERLHSMLAKVDSVSAEKYPANDVRRVIRSLEIYYATGKPRCVSEEQDQQRPDRYDAVLFALKWDRDELYERINRRVDVMLKDGLIEEVRLLMQADESVRQTAAQAIGFKEIRDALEGRVSMKEAIENVKTNSRHLAKRQETWFKRDKRVRWIEADGESMKNAVDEIYRQIREDMRING